MQVKLGSIFCSIHMVDDGGIFDILQQKIKFSSRSKETNVNFPHLFQLQLLQIATPKATPHVYCYVVAATLSTPTLRHVAPRCAFWRSGNVGTAVITVPAYFNDAQRQATKVPAFGQPIGWVEISI